MQEINQDVAILEKNSIDIAFKLSDTGRPWSHSRGVIENVRTNSHLGITMPALVILLTLGASCGRVSRSVSHQRPIGDEATGFSTESVQQAIQRDDAGFFEHTQGRADHWPVTESTESASDPLEAAALWGSPGVFRLLIKRSQDPALPRERQAHLLNLCVRSLPIEAAPEHFNPNGPKEQLRAWYRQVQQAEVRKDKILALLIQRGFPLDAADEDGLQPIHQAAFYANRAALKRLLAAKANVNQPSAQVEAPNPMPPFHGPATAEYYEGVAAQQTRLATRNRTPLELAILGRYMLATRLAGMGVSEQYVSPETQKEAITLLIEGGADVNHRAEDGLTPLMLASGLLVKGDYGPEEGARFGDPKAALDVVRLLLAKGADPKAVTPDLRTALSLAASAGFTTAIPVLRPLIPESLSVSNPGIGPGSFRPREEALLAALAAENLATARALFTPGMDVFAPSRTLGEPNAHPSAVELAARLSSTFTETLIAGEKDPARIQHARNLELTELLKGDSVNSPHLEIPRRPQALREILDRGAKADPKAGFDWRYLHQVVSMDDDEGDPLFLRLLNQDLAMDSDALRYLVVVLLNLPEPRNMELLKALHAKAGSFAAVTDQHAILGLATTAKDPNFYPQMVQWLQIKDPDFRQESLTNAVRGNHPALISYWLGQGANPYQKCRSCDRTAAEAAWRNESDSSFGFFLETLVTQKRLDQNWWTRQLDRSLRTAEVELPSGAKLDALAKLGITLAPFRQHPLWAKPGKPKKGERSFYAMHPETAEGLYELAKRGLNLNRSFEGEPFLVGLFNHRPSWSDGENVLLNVDLVREALKQGASPLGQVKGFSFLHIAAMWGQTELAQVLLDAGLPVNSTTAPYQAVPVISASAAGNAQMVAWLLQHGADPNRVTTNGWSALGAAKNARDRKLKAGENAEPFQEVVACLEQAHAVSSQPAQVAGKDS